MRPSIRFFLAGIMQGSHVGPLLHHQDYRKRITDVLKEHFPKCRIVDPQGDHPNSLDYDDATGREVFMHHNRLCRDVDVLIAFVPEASMGTAIEMWEAYRHDKVVLAISPLAHNWAIKFCSHEVFSDLASFETSLASGQLQSNITRWISG